MSSGPESSLREFLAEAEEILETIAEGLLELEPMAADGDPDPEIINSIFRGAHSLKGISGMFGFSQITEVSHKMETLLDALRMGRIRCERRVLDLLFEGIDLLKALCGKVAGGEAPEHPGGIAPFVERLLAAAGDQKPAQANLSDLGLGQEVLQVLTDYEVHRIEETLRDARRALVRVRASFPLDSFDTGLEGLNAALKPYGEIISTLPTPGSSGEETLDFDLIVGAKAGVEEIRRATEPYGAQVDRLGGAPTVSPPAPRAAPSAASSTALCDATPAEPGTSPPRPAARPTSETGDGDLRSLTKTIRVDLPKLDSLMNLVGELVIAKGRIQLVSNRLRDRIGFAEEALELSKAQKELDRKLSELQQAVMDVRMVPLGQLFSKLHRVMRKILQGSTKEVDLKISGAETELDKLIVEDLSDPLIHVIRNAVDHGIEDPGLREEMGKARKGTVKISARQRGNHVVIEISDDGAGLATEKIRRKAVEKGLISEETALTEKELYDLVFLPGFSTKDQVTEISGRGVGMDVLAKNIAALSGMIELSTREGKGTTVTIVLPITLAIIQALLVRVRDQKYAVPLNSVLETLALEPHQVKTLEGRAVLRLRDTTVPVAQIDHLLGMGRSETPNAYAVVVGVAEKRVAFGVDDLVSQQDVVIKSLGRRLQGLKGLAGATDLGDQQIVLVLDVAELADEAFGAA